MAETKTSFFKIIRLLFGILALMDRVFAYSSSIHVPLFEISLLSSASFLLIIKIIFYAAVMSFIIGFRICWSGLIASFSHFFLLLAFPAHVYAFAYLFPLGLWAFAAASSEARHGGKKFETPLAFLVSSVFLTASLHKLFHFDLMREWLSPDLLRVARASMLSVCPSMQCGLVEFIKYSVIPTEFYLGVMFLIPRTRKQAFFLAVIFHVILGTLANVRFVGFLMILLEVSILTAHSPLKLKTFFQNKPRWHFIFLGSVIFALSIAVLFFRNSIGADLSITILFYLPLVYVGATINRHREDRSSLQPIRFGKITVVFAIFLMIFGISPALNDYRKLNQWGWTMFSGAYRKNHMVKMDAKLARYESIPTFYPLVYFEEKGEDSFTFSSYDEEYLERYILSLARSQNAP